MNKIIYLVMESYGQYSDYRQNVICAYNKKSEAQDKISSLKEENRKFKDSIELFFKLFDKNNHGYFECSDYSEPELDVIQMFLDSKNIKLNAREDYISINMNEVDCNYFIEEIELI